MNIAILSDIHGNYVALEACLKFIDEFKLRRRRIIDHIIFLGDYVTDGPFPEKTMDLVYQTLKKYPCTCIRGNREEYLLAYEGKEHPWKRNSGTGILMYTYEHTRKIDWDFYKSLKNHDLLELPGIEPITIVHGSQFASRDNYYEEPAVGDYFLKNTKTRLILGGHSHAQHIVERYGKTYINPGSVGESQDGIGGHAQFSVITYDDISGDYDDELIKEDASLAKRFGIENFTIPYDVQRYIKEVQNTDVEKYSCFLPKLLMLFNQTGINYFFYGIQRVEELSKDVAANASEEIWEKVYAEMKALSMKTLP